MQINLIASESRKIKDLAKNDVWFRTFLTSNYNEIDSLVDTNITTVGDIRRIIKLILKILMFLYRR